MSISHIRGSAGCDALPGVERLLAWHGVTSYYPTKAPMAAILRALERLAGAIEQGARSNVQGACAHSAFIWKGRS